MDKSRDAKSTVTKAEIQAERLRREEIHAVLVDMRSKIKRYGISADQLFGPDLSDLVRYRDPESGSTWNGFGRPPKWIKGKDRERFRTE